MTNKILTKLAEIRNEREDDYAFIKCSIKDCPDHEPLKKLKVEKLAILSALEKAVNQISEQCGCPELRAQTLLLNRGTKEKCANCETLESIWKKLEGL